MPSGPLEGLQVLDLSRVLAGPYCTMLLADMGAEVVKVEEPGHGDLTREWGPPFLEGESAYFVSVNRNKRSIAVDLKSPGGREVILDLAARSDVVVENFRPGVAEGLGLGYGALKAVKPDIIYCSISGYGQDGPYRDRPALDVALQAFGGLMSITGEPGGPPVRVGVAVADLAAGMFAAIAILAALHRRGARAEGEYIDVSILDGLVSLLTYMAQEYLFTGRPPTAMGSGHPHIVPYQAYPTADGWIVVAAASDGFWRSTCEVLGLPHLVDDPRFRRNRDRVEHRRELEELLVPAFRRCTTAEWHSRLLEAGVPCGPVHDMARVLSDPQVLHRGMVEEVEHPAIGPLRQVGSPLKFLRGSPKPVLPPPLLGQHTREVLRGLGYTAKRIEALARSGVIALPEGQG